MWILAMQLSMQAFQIKWAEKLQKLHPLAHVCTPKQAFSSLLLNIVF